MNPNFNSKSFLRRPPVLAAAACRAMGSLSGGGNPTKQAISTVTGAAAGGYIGNRIGRDLEYKHTH